MKSRCDTCGQWFEDSELDDHLSTHLDEPTEPPAGEHVPLKCPPCNEEMDVYYSVPFKIGRSDPAARLLLGWVSELGEEPILIDLYVCPQCGRMIQFASQKTRERLKQSARHKP